MPRNPPSNQRLQWTRYSGLRPLPRSAEPRRRLYQEYVFIMVHKETDKIFNALVVRVNDDPLRSRLVSELIIDCKRYIKARTEHQLSFRNNSEATLDPSTVREERTLTDFRRRISHNALISDLAAVDRLCVEVGLQPLYGDDYLDREKTAKFARTLVDIIVDLDL